MLTCLPKSFCSWDYRILGVDAGEAGLTFNFFTEQGTLSIGDTEFAIHKHGPLSGRWTLEREGEAFAEATKPRACFRCFEVEIQDIRIVVQAQSAFTRSFDILFEEKQLGEIRPANAFTRRAFVECASRVPELAQILCFWLVAVTWRRSPDSTGKSLE